MASASLLGRSLSKLSQTVVERDSDESEGENEEVRSTADLINLLPREVLLGIFKYLEPFDIIRLGRVNRSWNDLSRDGKLWQLIGGSEFFCEMSAERLLTLVSDAAPFVRRLNLRGHKNLSPQDFVELSDGGLRNLTFLSLEQNLHFDHNALTHLLRANEKLRGLVVSGTFAFTNASCFTVSMTCRDLVMLDVSYCSVVTAAGVLDIIEACPGLRDLNISSLTGVHEQKFLLALHKILPNLTRLVMAYCVSLKDASIRLLLTGSTTTDEHPDDQRDEHSPAGQLRHLNLSFCTQLTNRALKDLAGYLPELLELELAGLRMVGDRGLRSVLATTPKLTFLDCDRVGNVGSPTLHCLAEHCRRLEHASFSNCANVNDEGVIAMLRALPLLRNLELDNTRIGDGVLEAAAEVTRELVCAAFAQCGAEVDGVPGIVMRISVYDCPNITWYGLLLVMRRNMERVVVSGAPRVSNSDVDSVFYVERPVESSSSPPSEEADSKVTLCEFTDEEDDLSLLPAGQIYVQFSYAYDPIFTHHLTQVHTADFPRAHELAADWSVYCTGASADPYFGYKRYVQTAMLQTAGLVICGFEGWVREREQSAAGVGIDVDAVLRRCDSEIAPASPPSSLHQVEQPPTVLQRRLSRFMSHGLRKGSSGIGTRKIGAALREMILLHRPFSGSEEGMYRDEEVLEMLFRETLGEQQLGYVSDPDVGGETVDGGEGGGEEEMRRRGSCVIC